MSNYLKIDPYSICDKEVDLCQNNLFFGNDNGNIRKQGSQ